MKRGLPWSVLVHVLGLLAVFFWGNRVTRAVVQPPRAISVRMQFEPPPDPVVAEEPVATPPVLIEETPAELPPKEVPEEPELRPEPEPEPEPEVRVEEPPAEEPSLDPADSEPAATAAAALGVSGPSLQGSTDTDFPFTWYLNRVQGLIARNWRPRQLGFRDRSRVACAVHFVIARGGAVSQVTLSEGSGLGLYDREALRAVSTTRLPPLPPSYGGANLGVTFIFNLEPGR